MLQHPRAHRVTISGARVLLANTIAKLINVSRSGALIRAGRELLPGSDWPLTLQLNARAVELTGRVVRLEPTQVRVDDGVVRRQFEIGFTFVEPSTTARTVLETVCDTTNDSVGVGVSLGFCRVSLVRHCPLCRSRSVSKAGPHRYACDDCQHFFRGFRVGALRVAR
jgi:hypothetical protein